jgi:hypothetical protein
MMLVQPSVSERRREPREFRVVGRYEPVCRRHLRYAKSPTWYACLLCHANLDRRPVGKRTERSDFVLMARRFVAEPSEDHRAVVREIPTYVYGYALGGRGVGGDRSTR